MNKGSKHVLFIVVASIILASTLLAPKSPETPKIDQNTEAFERANLVAHVLDVALDMGPCKGSPDDEHPEQIPVAQGSELCFNWHDFGTKHAMESTGYELLAIRYEDGTTQYLVFAYNSPQEYEKIVNALFNSALPGGFATVITEAEYNTLRTEKYAYELRIENGHVYTMIP